VRDPISERIARNNVTFREANEQIRAKADENDAQMHQVPFICERPRPDCVKIVRLSPAEYTDVRSNANHFMTAVGHEEAEKPVGRVVSQGERYVVVQKELGSVMST
jgi:hypothetical protein